jgi:hypothetical protein
MHQEGLAVWLLLLEPMQKGSARSAAFQKISESAFTGLGIGLSRVGRGRGAARSQKLL